MDESVKKEISRLVEKIVARAYQEFHFDEIADAIRYVDGTTKENDMIAALDFYKRIRAHKGQGGGGGLTGNCRLGDNVPDGCGEDHGLLHLDYTLVNCVTERLRDNLKFIQHNTCLVCDDWAYGTPACDGLHGLLLLDFSTVDCPVSDSVLWGYYDDAGN